MRTRRLIAAGVIGILLAGGAVAFRLHALSEARHERPVRLDYVGLTTGRYRGVAWELYGLIDPDRSLCLSIARPGLAGPHPSNTDLGEWGSACQFHLEKGYNDYSYSYSTRGPRGSYASFGPLPMTAARVRVATHETVPAMTLPHAAGLPRGKYWIHLQSPQWPGDDLEAGVAVKPRPLNAQGKPISFKAFR